MGLGLKLGSTCIKLGGVVGVNGYNIMGFYLFMFGSYGMGCSMSVPTTMGAWNCSLSHLSSSHYRVFSRSCHILSPSLDRPLCPTRRLQQITPDPPFALESDIHPAALNGLPIPNVCPCRQSQMLQVPSWCHESVCRYHPRRQSPLRRLHRHHRHRYQVNRA